MNDEKDRSDAPDTELFGVLGRQRVIDLTSSPQGLTPRAASQRSSSVFAMGWRAHSDGMPSTSAPQFADEELKTDWLAGWNAYGGTGV